jgi:hypothetical protein
MRLGRQLCRGGQQVQRKRCSTGVHHASPHTGALSCPEPCLSPSDPADAGRQPSGSSGQASTYGCPAPPQPTLPPIHPHQPLHCLSTHSAIPHPPTDTATQQHSNTATKQCTETATQQHSNTTTTQCTETATRQHNNRPPGWVRGWRLPVWTAWPCAPCGGWRWAHPRC